MKQINTTALWQHLANKRKALLRLVEKRYLNRSIVFATDLLFSIFASALVFIVVSYITPSMIPSSFMPLYLGLSLLASLLIFWGLKIYKSIIRLSTIEEVFRISLATTAKCIVLASSSWLILGHFWETLFLVVFDGLATLFALVILRAFLVYVYRRAVMRSGSVALYFFNGPSQTRISTRVRTATKRDLVIKGLFSTTPEYNGYVVDGRTVKVAETLEEFVKLQKLYDASALIFPGREAFKSFPTQWVDYCIRKKIDMILEHMPESIDDEESAPSLLKATDTSSKKQLKEVQIEDLLSRDEILVDMAPIAAELVGETILVTGAAGSIGSELVRQLTQVKPRKIVLLDFAESPLHNLRLELSKTHPQIDFVFTIGDIRNPKRLDYVFRTHRPSIVFHAAAYKHVPLMEENPCEAILSIVRGSKLVADQAIKYGAKKMVMISTDKAVNPSSVMGAAKRIAEIYVQSLDIAIKAGRHEGETAFVTTRFGNVLGSNGSVIPLFRDQIQKGGPVSVTHPKIVRYFMTIPEACRLVLEAGTQSQGGEIFVFDMGEAVKIDDLARRMIRLAGLEPDVDIDIVYSGLRPGEKLYEELLSNEENTTPTHMNKVLLAKVRHEEYYQVAHNVRLLEELAVAVDIEGSVRLMKQMVPEYHSLNSNFAQLEEQKASTAKVKEEV